MCGILPFVTLKAVFRIKNRLNSRVTFKDKISKEMLPLFFYKFQCCSRSATCYGKTKRHFKVCIFENMGFSSHTGKNSAVWDLMLVCGNIVSFGEFLFWLMAQKNVK